MILKTAKGSVSDRSYLHVREPAILLSWELKLLLSDSLTTTFTPHIQTLVIKYRSIVLSPPPRAEAFLWSKEKYYCGVLPTVCMVVRDWLETWDYDLICLQISQRYAENEMGYYLRNDISTQQLRFLSFSCHLRNTSIPMKLFFRWVKPLTVDAHRSNFRCFHIGDTSRQLRSWGIYQSSNGVVSLVG